jgi:hypothetical protein
MSAHRLLAAHRIRISAETRAAEISRLRGRNSTTREIHVERASNHL